MMIGRRFLLIAIPLALLIPTAASQAASNGSWDARGQDCCIICPHLDHESRKTRSSATPLKARLSTFNTAKLRQPAFHSATGIIIT